MHVFHFTAFNISFAIYTLEKEMIIEMLQLAHYVTYREDLLIIK